MATASIIIPAHNRPELLGEALASCLVQTYDVVEVVVVDDGSEPDLRPVLREAQAAICSGIEVRYVRQDRRGAPAARNRGVRESTGEFIQFLDSDDLLHPRKLEVQIALLERDPSLDMVYCLDEWFTEQIGDMRVLWAAPDGLEPLDRFPWVSPTWHTASPVWRRRALERIGAWEEGLECMQDWEFHLRALCAGIRYADAAEVLQFIRDHHGHRVSLGTQAVQFEESRLRAELLVESHLRKAHLLTRWRADGLAMFLLLIANQLYREHSFAQAYRTFWRAFRLSGSPGIKLLVPFMLLAGWAARVIGKCPASAQSRARTLLERFVPLPRHNRGWQNAPAPSRDVPQALLDAIKTVQQHHANPTHSN